MISVRRLHFARSPLPSRNRRAVQAAAVVRDESIQQNLPWKQGLSPVEGDDKETKKKKKKQQVPVLTDAMPQVDASEGKRGRRMRRATGAASPSGSSAAQQRLENDKIAFYEDDRTMPNYGGFGKGEMHWYALWVMTMKEEDLGQDLEASISRLGQVRNSEGNLVAREVESWVPTKMKLKWNNRVKRMSESPVKYGDGNWVFLQCIMDNEVYDLLADTPAFRGFRPESCIEIRDKFEVMHTFPKPLTEDFLASVREWETTVDEPDEASLALAEMHANSEPEVEMERADEPELDTFRTGQDDYMYDEWGASGDAPSFSDDGFKKSRRNNKASQKSTWDDDSNSTFSNSFAQNETFMDDGWGAPQDFDDSFGGKTAQNSNLTVMQGAEAGGSAAQDSSGRLTNVVEDPELDSEVDKSKSDPTDIELEWGVDTPANRKAIARTLKSMENAPEEDPFEENDSDEEEEETSSFSLFTDSFAKGKYANRSFDPKFTLGGDDRDRNRNRRNDRFGQNSGRGFRGRGGRGRRDFQDNDHYEGSYQQEGFGRDARRGRNFSDYDNNDYSEGSFQEEGFGRGRGGRRGRNFSHDNDDDYYAGLVGEREFGGRGSRGGRRGASGRFNGRGGRGRDHRFNDFDSFDDRRDRRNDFGGRKDTFREEGRAADDDDFSGWNDFGGNEFKSDFRSDGGGRKQRGEQRKDDDLWGEPEGGSLGRTSGGQQGDTWESDAWDDDFWGQDDAQQGRSRQGATGRGSIWDDDDDDSFDSSRRGEQDRGTRTERSSGRFQSSGRRSFDRRQPRQQHSEFDAVDSFSADEAAMFDDFWSEPGQQHTAQPRSNATTDRSDPGRGSSKSRSPGQAASEPLDLWDDGDDMFGGSSFGGGAGGGSDEWDQWDQQPKQQNAAATGSASNSHRAAASVPGAAADRDAPGNGLWGDEWGDFSANTSSEAQGRKRTSAGSKNMWDEFDDFGSFDDKFDSNRQHRSPSRQQKQRSTPQSFDRGFSEYDVDFDDLAHLDANDTDVWGSPEPTPKPHGRSGSNKNQTRASAAAPRESFSDDEWLDGGFGTSPAAASGDDGFDSGVTFTGWGDNGSAGKPLTHKPGQGPNSRQTSEGSRAAAVQSSDLWSGDGEDFGGSIWGTDDWQSSPSAPEGNASYVADAEASSWGSKASKASAQEDTGSKATAKVAQKKLIIKEVPDPEYLDPVDPATNQPVSSDEGESGGGSGGKRRMRRMRKAS